ncbi:MAG: hypothetical protein IT423_20325 [Pirellulaceae bacterium]|nr:hypothetical protein [Pirellulaceae bacterium]
MISAVPFAIAAVPAAMYLMILGRFRLSVRPMVTTGWRDAAALGIAIMGLMAIGPMQLFFPTYAAARFAGWVWGMLFGLYLLSLLLVVLGCRPRLIVYGLDEEAFFQTLRQAALRVDPQALWHGQILTLPTVGLQLAAEPTCARGVQTVVIVTALVSAAPWMQLERELVKECSQVRTENRTWAGVWLVAGGLCLLLISAQMILADPAAALLELRDFFTR